ncbi:MAG: UDP-N-acetylmuramate--L-alanine ligase, partial [Clostridia bacterium]|nr:UDP-N-acetylmuramate--L-alanine ligase [Clostridia bacterium]
SQADRLVLADIYAARETDTLGVSSARMAQEIDGAVSFPTFEAIADYVRKEARAGDVVVTVGAGDIFRVGELLLEE